MITGEKGQKDLMNDRQPCYNVKIQTEKDMNKLFIFVLKVNFFI